jgi:hypothetical protein
MPKQLHVQIRYQYFEPHIAVHVQAKEVQDLQSGPSDAQMKYQADQAVQSLQDSMLADACEHVDERPFRRQARLPEHPVDALEYGPHMDLSNLPQESPLHLREEGQESEALRAEQEGPNSTGDPSPEAPRYNNALATTSMVPSAASDSEFAVAMPFPGTVALATLVFTAVSWGRRQGERDRFNSKVLQDIVDKRRRQDSDARAVSESGGLSPTDRAAAARAKVSSWLHSSASLSQSLSAIGHIIRIHWSHRFLQDAAPLAAPGVPPEVLRI